VSHQTFVNGEQPISIGANHPVQLAATEYGRGSPVVILHGLFGSGRNWMSIAQALAETHRVLVLDLRNHGASPWADTMSYAEMADDLRVFLHARRLGPVALVGHSMGGKTAMVSALHFGEDIERLLVVDIGPATYPPSQLSYIRAMQSIDLGSIVRRADADARLASAIPDPAERSFLLLNLAIEGTQARWRINLAALDRELPRISGFPEFPPEIVYTGPTLFVGGARSGYLRPEHEPRIRQLFPRAEIARVPGAGHWVPADHPAAFLSVVRPFLAGCS
jgi:esterase